MRKYVTIMPLFYEKTHFFKKKSKKKRHKTVLEDSILMVRETLYRSLPHVATLTRKQENRGQEIASNKKIRQAQNGDLNFIN